MSKENIIKRVTDYIKTDDIRKWNKDDIITIDAGTGSGKSYWVKNILYLIAAQQNKKILVFTNRNRLKDQWKNDIKTKEDTITVMNYQAIENRVLAATGFDFSEYDYIVCDEYHYFFTDAKFNHLTDISLNTILNQKNKTRIFMSATADLCQRYIKNCKKLEVIEYIIPKNEITNNIDTLNFYNKDKTAVNIIKEAIETKPNEKLIYFCQSASKAYEVYKEFEKQSVFCCSESNEKFYKYVNQDEIDDMLKNNRFDKQILITTTALDCGVNIVEKSLKHIIADVEDIETLQQCLGRKRSQTVDDTICIYIKNINNNYLGGRITQNRNKIKMAEYLRDHNANAFVQQYPRQIDYSKIIYDVPSEEDWNLVEKKVNEIMLFKYRYDNVIFDAIIDKGYDGYKLYMQKLLCQDVYFDLQEEDDKHLKDCLEDMFQNKVVLLRKEDRKELIEKINLIDGSHSSIKNNKIKYVQKIKTLNTYLQDTLKLDYQIEEFKHSKTIDGKTTRFKASWRIVKIIR